VSAKVMERYEVGPLQAGLAFGATVRGLQLVHLADDEVRRSLYDLWIDKGVVLFRDGDDSSEMQVELSKCFGRLERHTFKEVWVEGHPELVKVKYYPDDGNIYDVDGERVGGYLSWHKDLVYTDAINHGGILRPAQLPEHGGQTGFIDQIAAYAALPETLRAKIETLHVVYVMDLNQQHIRFSRPTLKFIQGARSFKAISHREYQYPRILHPMVYTQEETGRKVLNISPWFAVGIYEIGGPDGEALLREAFDYCIDSGPYFHDWRMGDMMLWDNWRVLHSALGVPPDETRVMQRTTISGDYALGRKLDAGAEDLAKFDV
jgi:taurine dioxygenase